MGPSGVSKKRQIITTAAVLLVIVLIVTATVVANKKQDSSEVAADTSATTTATATPSPTPAAAVSDDCDENGNKLRGDGSVDDDEDASCQTTATTTPTPAAAASTSNYKDGTYTAKGSYQSPGGSQGITVKVTLVGGKVTDSTVTPNASDRESEEYQDRFVSGYKSLVTGKAIDAISLSRVSGSSLTSQGFNNALSNIKNQAKA